jgi:hypothetical protein
MFFLAFSAPSLFAQEYPDDDDDYPDVYIDWIAFEPILYTRGDRTFNIGMGVLFPTFFHFANPIDGDDQQHNISMGGTGTLAFNYFLNSNVFIGGELSGMFAPTLERNMLIMIPFGVRLGYQFLFHRFEFPVSVMVGGVNQMRLEQRYFGLIIKPSAAAFWRFNQDWSFGLNASWWVVPQRGYDAGDVRRTVIGNFLSVTFTARYHF